MSSINMSMLTNNWYLIAISFLLAYLLGSINTAVIVTRAATKGKEDIREMGSGNAGFTNVLRSVGKVPAILTIVFDFLKSIIAVILGGVFFQLAFAGSSDIAGIIVIGKYLCGFFCILGHSFPVFFHFRGGKGIVSAAGMMLVADWRVFLMIVTTFVIVFIFSKIISLASITCACLFPVYTFILTFFVDYFNFNYPVLYVVLCTLAALLIAVFVVIKHSSNIKRLLAGEEKKITPKK
ncbi:MAG: glycerol-3-phosphate 1-O-acyltransferase PlsY [Ruminococcus sp.]|nr:glycerol-3-phosphate 1-O-acyltransferase PlsY [Ruminococcus sp.]